MDMHSDEFLTLLGKTNATKFQAMLASVEGITDVKLIIPEYEKITGLIHSLCKEVDTTELLAATAAENLFFTATSSIYPELDNPERLDQSHIEFLQALILQMNEPDVCARPASMDEKQQIHGALIKLFSLAILYRAKTSKGDKEKEKLLEGVRASTQILRSSAYPQQTRRMAKEIFCHLNDRFQDRYGVRAESLVDLIFAIVDEVEGRASAVKLLNVLNNDAFIHTHSAIYSFSPSELLDLYPGKITEEDLEKVLLVWSFKYGGLKTFDSKLFILDNPISTKPFIKLANGSYFCPVPGALLASCFNLLEMLIEKIGKPEKEKYHSTRAKFLEAEAKRLFTAGFPAGLVASNVKWGSGQDLQGECDVVIKLKPYLILCECKGHRPSGAALRGAPDSLQDTIDEMITAPSNQSARFEEWLKQSISPQELECSEGSLVIDLETTPIIVRLSTTMEIMAGRLSNRPMLEASGFASDLSLGAPTIPIADLDCVFEMLPTQSQRLHYLIRRWEIENTYAMSTDELGLLYVYLQNSLLTPLPHELSQLPMLDGLAIGLDSYFMQEWTGQQVSKPLHKITDWTRQMIKALDSIPYGVCIGNVLLSMNLSEQTQLEKRIDALLERVRNTELNDSLDNVLRAVSSIGPVQIVLTVLGYKALADPAGLLEQVVRNSFEEKNASVSFGIAMDVDNRKYPYNLHCIVFPDQSLKTNL